MARSGFTFAALYKGKCAGCGQQFASGETVEYNDTDDLVLSDCCGGISAPADAERVSVTAVMPRGRTVRDRCPRCFQIPATSGACGCAE